MQQRIDVEDELELVELDQGAPTDKTLERAPARVVQFINAVAKNDVILGLLAARGYSAEDHNEAWELLRNAAELSPSIAPLAKKIADDPSVGAAIDQLDAWDNEHFPIIASALARRFAKQRAKLFENLQPQEGALSVVAVQTLLERLELLAKGKLTDDAAADKEANALLVRRMYGKELRAELSRAIAVAQSLPEWRALDSSKQEERSMMRRAALIALHGWWTEWATTARKAIKRRSLLVSLGLATRRASAKPEEPVEPAG